MCFLLVFFFKQKTAYEMRISDWSSDVCSSDLVAAAAASLGAALTGRPAMLSQGKVIEIAHPDWVCRTGLLGDCISWRPAIGMDEGFAKTTAWYKAADWLRPYSPPGRLTLPDGHGRPGYWVGQR